MILPDVPDTDDANAHLFHSFGAYFAGTIRRSARSLRASGIVGRQPRLCSLETSRSLRGVPSGLRRVPGEFALESDDVANQFGQFADGDVFAATDIDDLGRVVFLEQEKAGLGQIIDMQKFAPRFARTPDDHARARR